MKREEAVVMEGRIMFMEPHRGGIHAYTDDGNLFDVGFGQRQIDEWVLAEEFYRVSYDDGVKSKTCYLRAEVASLGFIPKCIEKCVDVPDHVRNHLKR